MMDIITVLIIIGNAVIILVLLYLIRLSFLRGRDESDKKSSKRTRSSTSLRKKQDELPSEKDDFPSGLGESSLQNLKDDKIENENTSLRQRTVRLSTTLTTDQATDPQNEEFGLVQEEFIKSASADEVEQPVNEEFGGGSTEKANFTAGAENKPAIESSGLEINNLFSSASSRVSHEAGSLLPSSQLCKLNIQTSQGCLCVSSEQPSAFSVSGLCLDSSASSCLSAGNLTNELVHSLIQDPFSSGSCCPNTSTVKNNSSPISELSSVAESLSEDLLRNSSSDALTTVQFLLSGNEVADNLTNVIVRDVFHQIGGPIQREQTLQQLSRFAESFTSSVVQEAVGEIADEHNKEKFVNNLAKNILNGGLQEVVAVANTGKQEKSKLCEYGKFSEQCSSKILADGIRLAAAQKHDSSVQELLVENSVREGMQVASAARQHAESLTSTVCKSAIEEATLSSALKPHIRGVIQNLVNEAIYEAVLRVGAVDKPTCKSTTDEDYASDVVCSTVLESHVEDTIQELISSAIETVKSDKDKVSVADDEITDDQLKTVEDCVGLIVNSTIPCSIGSDDKMASDKVLESPLPASSFSDITEKASNDINANMNHLEHSIEADQIVPDIVSSLEQIPEDIFPDKSRHDSGASSLDVQMRDKKPTSPTGFWRRSLIEDLENDIDLDESLTSSSEKSELESPKFNLDSPTLPNDMATRASDESSDEEFLDSSEDEIIDHAEEARMGAVGGSSQHAASDDDGDFSDSDEDDEYEPFDAYLTVDGLCMSVPKEKHVKHKGKSKHSTGKHKPKYRPRHRVKSAGHHFNRAIVIDNGCGVLKAGFAGERKPRVVEPAVIGIPKRYSLQMTGMNGKKDRKYGSAATNAAGVLHLDYPMKPGMIDSWTDIEDMWEYMLYSMLGISEGDHPIVLTEVAHNPVKNREKIAEILFEHLSVPAMYLADQLSLALYASGMTTGVSVSSGFSVTEAAVVYEGHTLPHTAQQLDIAGQQLTENLRLLLRDNKGLNFVSSSEWQLVNTMKETLAYVAQDYSEEFNKYQTGKTDPKYFTLPDGQMVEISSELISSVEPLFEPESLVAANDTVASQLPLPKMVTEAINRCDVDLQDVCYRSVVLSGGTTNLPGIVPRLQREVQKLSPKVRKIRAPDERSVASWIGGSILASLSTFENQYITIDEYADSGPSTVRRKCF